MKWRREHVYTYKLIRSKAYLYLPHTYKKENTKVSESNLKVRGQKKAKKEEYSEEPIY